MRWRAWGLPAALLVAASAAGPARAQAPANGPLTVRIGVAADTILFPATERLAIAVRPSGAARVVATVTATGATGAVVWRSDTLAPGASEPIGWDLRGADGVAVPAGRFRLSVAALGARGDTARAAVVLLVTRLPADTQPLPLPLDSTTLEPETLVVGQTTPWAIFIGAGAAILPYVIGREELRHSHAGRTGGWLVAGGVTVAGFVAFLAGRRAEFSPESAARNAERRAERAERLADVRAANARARVAAAYRIVREGGAP